MSYHLSSEGNGYDNFFMRGIPLLNIGQFVILRHVKIHTQNAFVLTYDRKSIKTSGRKCAKSTIGKNPQFVATSVAGPTPEELHGENGQASFVRLGTLTQRGTRGICTLYTVCPEKENDKYIKKYIIKRLNYSPWRGYVKGVLYP
jgi:hypothetical protein